MLKGYSEAAGFVLPVSREKVSFIDDYGINNDCREAVRVLQQAGVIMARNGNWFDPKSSATRAEISSVLYRYIKMLIDPATT